MPEYKSSSKLPFIPTESELNMLIGCAGPKLQPFLQTSGKDDYVSKAVTTLEEMTKLIEQSFEYLTDTKIEETTYKLFRKKKAWHPS